MAEVDSIAKAEGNQEQKSNKRPAMEEWIERSQMGRVAASLTSRQHIGPTSEETQVGRWQQNKMNRNCGLGISSLDKRKLPKERLCG